MSLHHLFFEREMRRDTAVDLTEAIDHLLAIGLFANQCVNIVDLVDQSFVLEIDALDSGAEIVSPFKQRHAADSIRSIDSCEAPRYHGHDGR